MKEKESVAHRSMKSTPRPRNCKKCPLIPNCLKRPRKAKEAGLPTGHFWPGNAGQEGENADHVLRAVVGPRFRVKDKGLGLSFGLEKDGKPLLLSRIPGLFDHPGPGAGWLSNPIS